ncbi:UNVERIFIED_CONTAM: hypothetical protein Sradi_3627400 [Sesamum radiatum]|uniref:Uncharacterized protein n=1 Tax=Sesamum radiatum TaxID=300843 RepID=A0AAW2QJD3_SESRA
MASNAANLQRQWFYDLNWSRQMEKTFLNVIVEQIGLEERGFPDPYSIRKGMREVNRKKRIAMEYVDLPDPAWMS